MATYCLRLTPGLIMDLNEEKPMKKKDNFFQIFFVCRGVDPLCSIHFCTSILLAKNNSIGVDV